jgi:hypothetical protein
VEAVGEEGDEDMRLDARLVLVKDRPDGEVAPCLREAGAGGSNPLTPTRNRQVDL